MNQDILAICEKLNKNPQDVVINSYKSKKKITYAELIEALIINGSMKNTAIYLSVTDRTITRATPKLGLPKLAGGPANYKYTLLNLINKKECHKCSCIKFHNEFTTNNLASSVNLQSECRDCKNSIRKDWYIANREKHIQKVISRHRKIKNVLSEEDVLFIFNRDSYKCQKCGLTNEEHLINHGQRLHLDHIVPLYFYGEHSIDNLQLLCRSCNSSKGIALVDQPVVVN
jgi:5-methylcytosine-specific restriction endonuclease McrA